MKMIREWINTLLAQWGMQTETVGWMERIVIIAIILLIAFLADLIWNQETDKAHTRHLG